MSFFTKVKNAGTKAKIQGEMALLDRQAKTRKQQFGVDLYDLLDRLDRSNSLGSAGSTSVKAPMFLGTQSQKIKHIFDATQVQIRTLQDDHDAKAQEVEHLQVNRERARPAVTGQEKMQRAGEWISSNSSEAKLKTEMHLLQRKIKQYKEEFGLAVFELVEGSGNAVTAPDGSEKKGMLGGVKSGLTNQLSKLSGNEREIQQCIDRAKSDVEYIYKQKTSKQREVDFLSSS